LISAPRTRRTRPASRRRLSLGLLSFDGDLSFDLNSGLSQFRSCQNRPTVILIFLFYRRLRTAVPSRQQPRAHAAPYVTGPADLPCPKQRRCGPECHTKPAPTAAAILAKRNTPFSSSRINTLHAGVGARRCRNGPRSAPRCAAAGTSPVRAPYVHSIWSHTQNIRSAILDCFVEVLVLSK